MSTTPSARRTSYGPTSPVLGTRGAATRKRILEAALEVFQERGYHAAVMEDFAHAVGMSRAAVYQYFEGKEEIFIELINASGDALLEVTSRERSLGPSAEGFSNLREWLDEWSAVFSSFETVFVEWANVDSSNTPLRPHLDRFVEANTSEVAARLVEAGTDLDPETTAVIIAALTERAHYVTAVHQLPVSLNDLLDGVAVALQLLLFPTCDPSVVRGLCKPASAPLPHPLTPPVRGPRRSDNFSQRGAATVERLLDAASQVFRSNGFAEATVDQIVTLAGVARGTFYKYFDSLLDILGELAVECGYETALLGSRLSHIDPDDGSEIRAWLAEFLRHQRRYAGVFLSWTMTHPDEPRLLAASRAVVKYTLHGFSQLYAISDNTAARPERRAAGTLLMSLLERAPDFARGTVYEPSDDDMVEAQALFLERGLLGLTGAYQ